MKNKEAVRILNEHKHLGYSDWKLVKSENASFISCGVWELSLSIDKAVSIAEKYQSGIKPADLVVDGKVAWHGGYWEGGWELSSCDINSVLRHFDGKTVRVTIEVLEERV